MVSKMLGGNKPGRLGFESTKFKSARSGVLLSSKMPVHLTEKFRENECVPGDVEYSQKIRENSVALQPEQ